MGNSKNFHPSKMIIDRGEASVDNHFLRVKILTITILAMLYLYTTTTIRHLIKLCVCQAFY